MSESLQKLALSSTFAISNGELVSVDEPGALSESVDYKPGSIIDSKYKVLALIGEGGMGAVFKVHHIQLQKDMALKTFRSHTLSAEPWQRFQREAQAIAKLKHQNIVEVFDFGIVENRLPYYTMSFLQGRSLAEAIESSGALKPDDALTLFLEVGEALAHAHKHGIVHRDIKPANIFLQDSGRSGALPEVKIVDFGIAKLVEDSPDTANQSLTQAGMIFGSPLYMSPEQIQGAGADHRSDIYSYGCALFETLTGAPPFVGDNAFATMMCHLNKRPASLHGHILNSFIPQRLERLMAKLLEKDPGDRYQSFDEVLTDVKYSLDAILEHESRINKQHSDSAGRQVEDALEDRAPARFGYRLPLLALGGLTIALLAGAVYFGLKPAPLQSHVPVKQAVTSNAQLPEAAPSSATLEGDRDTPEQKKHREEEAASTVPFRLSRHDGPNGFTTFLFPSYDSIGLIGEKDTRCQFRVSVPNQGLVYFRPTEEMFLEPRLFRRFKADDFRILSLQKNEGCVWNADHFKYMTHLTALRNIQLSRGPRLDDHVVPFLSKFPQLTEIGISKCPIDGAALANSSLVNRLEVLRVDHLEQMSALFAAAAKSTKCKLQILHANDCHVTDEDLKNVAKIKGLLFFQATNADLHGSGIASLAKSNLMELCLSGKAIESTYLADFGLIKSLKHLVVKDLPFTPMQKHKLQKDLPNCRIEF